MVIREGFTKTMQDTKLNKQNNQSTQKLFMKNYSENMKDLDTALKNKNSDSTGVYANGQDIRQSGKKGLSKKEDQKGMSLGNFKSNSSNYQSTSDTLNQNHNNKENKRE